MMMTRLGIFGATMAGFLACAGGAFAQTGAADASGAAAKAPDALYLYFAEGSSAIRPQDVALLDQAGRLYREGHPLVMIVTGTTDLTGSAGGNLVLSQARANHVVAGLVARGIPVGRFQVVAAGQTDPTVPTPPGVAEAKDRRVEVTWK
jgi:outer membrane protein OmpA-like peptidoglycan-associated protein